LNRTTGRLKNEFGWPTFLFAEDIISSASQIRWITSPRPNIVEVELSTHTVIKAPTSQRGFMMTSACGLCGKVSLESLAANRCPVLPLNGLRIDAGVIHQLPHQLRQRQDIFESTGGLHAAALFNPQGELESLREDVSRHNAVDKLVGHALLSFRTPLRESVMLVSGRASFELVQKASMAGVALLAAVGAPSSLAVASRPLWDDADRVPPQRELQRVQRNRLHRGIGETAMKIRIQETCCVFD